jgi:hypothetical protein
MQVAYFFVNYTCKSASKKADLCFMNYWYLLRLGDETLIIWLGCGKHGDLHVNCLCLWPTDLYTSYHQFLETFFSMNCEPPVAVTGPPADAREHVKVVRGKDGRRSCHGMGWDGEWRKGRDKN